MNAPFASLVPTLRQHFTGFIVSRIRRAVAASNADHSGEEVTLDNVQQNGMWGVYQARVRLAGDATVYRLLLAPANAPIRVQGRDIEDYFAQPLGSEPGPVLERAS